LGLPGERSPKLDDLFVGYRYLVISPYVTADGIDAVIRPMAQGTNAILISRAEELDRHPTGALDNLTVPVINQAAEISDEEDLDPAAAAEQPRPIPFGALHAKAIIVEKDRVARAFFGSANATIAGLHGNIEFLCEFDGAPSRLGVASVLDDPDGFAKLLEDYVPPPVPVIDEVAEFGRRLDEYLVDAAQRSFVLTVRPADGKCRGTSRQTARSQCRQARPV
jgi:phosphatidylserine/phosphatidylglycerophosphate/cardiolipin synthase-like enzyme